MKGWENYTEADAIAHNERVKGSKTVLKAKGEPEPASDPKPARKGKITRQGMNKLEAAYANVLEMQKRAGEIRDYRFEALKLKLAARTFYTPDFLVIGSCGKVELHECKGFPRDDWRVKWKVAIEQYWFFEFVLVTKSKGEWVIKREWPSNCGAI